MAVTVINDNHQYELTQEELEFLQELFETHKNVVYAVEMDEEDSRQVELAEGMMKVFALPATPTFHGTERSEVPEDYEML